MILKVVICIVVFIFFMFFKCMSKKLSNLKLYGSKEHGVSVVTFVLK